jgi:hypothetical protein
LDFRDPYTLKSLYRSLIRPKLEYASCVWNPFYDVCVDRMEGVQRRFIRYALRGLGWMDMHDLPPYEDRYALLHSYKEAIDCLYDVYFRCSEWESKLTKLVVRSRLDYTTISDLRYRASAY